MLNVIVRWSIAHRLLVVIISLLLSLWGLRVITQMPLDVFPSFAPPQIEIQTEAPGLAPEEVESLVTRPIESAMNGTPGAETVRSSSAVGISVVRMTFNWGTDIYRARQLVTERLQQAQSQLPKGVETPQITPTSSPIGEIVKYAFTVEAAGKGGLEGAGRQAIDGNPSNGNPQLKIDLMEVRRLVDWQVKNRLLAVPGIAQLVIFGGDVRQYQVLVDPNKLKAFDVTLKDVTEAAEKANVNAPGGFLTTPDRELLVREVGRIQSLEQLNQSAITARNGTPILLGQVAETTIGAAVKRGDGSLNGQPAIVVIVSKQPQADTPTVTRAVEAAMEELKVGLPPGVKVTKTFLQEEFIEASVKNVEDALRDGILIVSIVLILFLMNWRTVIISLSALPISLLFGMIILHTAGQGINTMTLGGLAVAIGSVVDDAIVDMENVYRRLRENQLLGNPQDPLKWCLMDRLKCA